MATHTFLVISNAVPGREAEFNRWYTEQHLSDVLKVPGFVAARRFEVAQDPHGLPGRYVAIYEMDTEDPAATLAALETAATSGDMVMTDTLDMDTVSATLLRAITDRITR